MTDSTEFVLSDHKVLLHSQNFVADVMSDENLQREGGTAIWKSVNHAIKPGMVKLTGATLIAVSLGFFKLFLSPF